MSWYCDVVHCQMTARSQNSEAVLKVPLRQLLTDCMKETAKRENRQNTHYYYYYHYYPWATAAIASKHTHMKCDALERLERKVSIKSAKSVCPHQFLKPIWHSVILFFNMVTWHTVWVEGTFNTQHHAASIHQTIHQGEKENRKACDLEKKSTCFFNKPQRILNKREGFWVFVCNWIRIRNMGKHLLILSPGVTTFWI